MFKTTLVTLGLTIAIFLIGFGITTAPAQADHTAVHTAQGGVEEIDSGISVTKVVEVSLQILSYVAGIISVIMIIIAGLKYVVSQGGEATSSARNTILYAVVGIVVVILSQVIIRFVLKRLT